MANDQDVKEFVSKALAELNESDAQMARVTEDLVSLLVDKSLILFTDLPQSVQKKLLHRESLREKVREPIISIVAEDDIL